MLRRITFSSGSVASVWVPELATIWAFTWKSRPSAYDNRRSWLTMLSKEWEGFKGPATNQGAWVVSAFPQMLFGEVRVGQELTVEEVRVATHLDENEDPEYLLNVKVRNVGL